MNTQRPISPIQKRIAAAQGKILCDLIIEDVSFLDVFSCKFRTGTIAISDGVVVGIESGLKARRTISGRGKTLVPGFIDAHVHIESSLLVPPHFQDAVLKRGTTTAICDPHELANVSGVQGIQYFLDAALELALDLRVMLSSCVPATDFETNGAGKISAAQLVSLLSHPKALGLAEVMNVPGVLNAAPEVIDKLEAFSHLPIDGHCPLVNGQALSAYASAGISSCHESSNLDEAAEKLTKGISVWIREGSVAKDLQALIPLLNMATSTSIGFCTDDRNPLDIAKEGHIDHLVRSAIKYGIEPEIAYRAASFSVARHYRLAGLGAIAPGYRADLVMLDDSRSCTIHSVYKNGIPVDEIALAKASLDRRQNSIRAETPSESDLGSAEGRVNVIGVRSGRILTEHLILDHNDPGVARLSVLERYGKKSKPANGYVLGFGSSLNGAIASSVGHDSHNLIVVGTNAADMQTALSALIASAGGFCVVQNRTVLAQLALPFGGLMSQEPADVIEQALKKLHAASASIGCELPEPFLQLAFLSLPVIPSLKLTDKGLFDVNLFKVIDVRAS
ncbi:MAG: adenine deaminase [Bdellovibrionota bacterium]